MRKTVTTQHHFQIDRHKINTRPAGSGGGTGAGAGAAAGAGAGAGAGRMAAKAACSAAASTGPGPGWTSSDGVSARGSMPERGEASLSGVLLSVGLKRKEE